MRGRAGIFAVAALACAAIVPARQALADTFTVNSTKDRLDANPGDGICADADGKCTLRAAVGEANAFQGVTDDQIDLPAGTFKLTRDPTAAVSNDEGDLDLTEAVVLNGSGRRNTVIEQTVRDRVIRSVPSQAEVLDGAILTDLTVRGGRLRGGEPGGGIYSDGDLELDLSAVVDNRAAAGPGNGVDGAGIYLGDNNSGTQSDVLIDRSVIRINATAVRGGGTAQGGGIFVDSGTESVVITKSKVTGNEADPGGPSAGGGIATVTSGVTVRDTTLSGNRADFGGAIHINTGSPVQDLLLDSSTVSGNNAEEGAGLYINGGIADVENSTFSRNTEQELGTGSVIYNAGDLSIEHATVAGNVAKPAIDADGSGLVTLEGSIVAGAGTDCIGPDSAIASGTYNVFSDNSCSDGGTDHVGDPEVRVLADNGGRTRTMALRAGSPAIDHVTAGCPPPATDQRGIIRAQGPACDAGAFERVQP